MQNLIVLVVALIILHFWFFSLAVNGAKMEVTNQMETNSGIVTCVIFLS